MSKPEDIPQDVWDEALRLWQDEEADPGEVIIARAIMAAKKEERDQIFSKVFANPSSVVLDAMAAERSDQIKRNGHGEWGFRDIWLAGVRAVRGDA